MPVCRTARSGPWTRPTRQWLPRRMWKGRLLGQMVALAAWINTLVLALVLAQVPAAAKDGEKPVHLVVLGDSLSAGYGLAGSEAFPAVLERRLAEAGQNVKVTNAGVSGDTTAGGLARLDWAVPEGTDAVIVELGANDMLRGQPVAAARANLERIIHRLKARGIAVMLAGMRASRNLGDEYANAFDQIYPALADKYDVMLYPFFLAGVALDPALNQRDGMHPTAKGVEVIVRKITPSVVELLERARKH
jgi:acyl-CoA thioesterase-1